MFFEERPNRDKEIAYRDQQLSRVEDEIANLVRPDKIKEILDRLGYIFEDQDQDLVLRNLQHNIVSTIHEAFLARKQLSAYSSPPVAQKLYEKDGFSLVLLQVSAADDSSTQQFIVGVKNNKAVDLLKKPKITTLDFERNEIVSAFGPKEEVSLRDQEEAIAFFENHFLVNISMELSFSSQYATR